MKITTALLNEYADKIENRMNRLRLPVTVTGGKFYPSGGFVEFILDPTGKADKLTRVDQIVNAIDDIANALQNASVRAYKNASAQTIVEVQMFNPEPPDIDTLISGVPDYSLVMGRDRIGNALTFDLTDPTSAHLLVSGSTGSGKTAMAHSVLIAAARMHKPTSLQMAIIDPNNAAASWLMPEITNHISVMPDTEEKAGKELKRIANNMFSRNKSQRILVYIDEMTGLVQDSKESLEAIETITQQGRKYGVHILACTQKPTVSALGSLMKANMRRVVGRMASPEDSKVASGVAGLGAEKLSGNGQFIYVDRYQPRFQSALPDGYGKHVEMPTLARPLEIISKGVRKDDVIAAILELKDRGETASKSKILKELGFAAGGDNWKNLTNIWQECLDETN